jgi:hypothetical protein
MIVDFLLQHPRPFFSLVREIFPENLEPTLTHRFFSLLNKKVIFPWTLNIYTYLNRFSGRSARSSTYPPTSAVDPDPHPDSRGSASFWLPGSAPGSASTSYKNQEPNPHHNDKLDPEPNQDPQQFADDKPKCMEYEPILKLFQGFELGFGSGSASGYTSK